MRGKSVFAFAVLAAGFVFVAPGIAAQEVGDAGTWLRYNAEKKGEAESAIIEAFIPVLGHAYAGDARRGFLPAAVSVGGLVLMMAGSADLDAGMMGLGSLGYLVGRVWGIVSAYQTAQEYNASLRQRLNISVGPGRGADSFGLTFGVSTR